MYRSVGLALTVGKKQRRGEKMHFLAKMSRAEPYASKLTTAFGGLANFILIDKQSKKKFELSPTTKKDLNRKIG